MRLDVDRSVATITLDRPERLNSYTVEVGRELFGALGQLDDDDGVRAIVVQSTGPHFCAGADLEAGGDTFAGANPWHEVAQAEARVAPWVRKTPVIAAIQGAAVGIGATLPLQWDLRVASDDARFGFVFTRRGIVPEAGSTWILPRLVGLATAMDWMVTGRFVGAAEALDRGLVSRVVARDELSGVAHELAHMIAERTAPVAVAVTRRLLWQQLGEPDPAAGKAVEDAWFHWIGTQPDAAEGVEAFLDKRRPRWSDSCKTLKREPPWG